MFRRKSSRGEFQNFTSLFVILIFMGHAIPCAAISQFTMAEIVQRATHADHSLLTDSLTASANLSRLDNGIEITKKILREHKELGSHEKYNYSRLLISAGLLEKARKIALLIPSKGEKAPLRYLALAEISLRKGRLKSGEKLFIRAGNLGEPSGYYMAALSKMKRGNYGAALSLLDKIGDSSPLFSQKVQKTAIALTKSGRSGEAISLIGKSIPLLPGGEEIKKIDLLILKSTLEVNEGVSRGELDQRDWAISSLHEMKKRLTDITPSYSGDDQFERFISNAKKTVQTWRNNSGRLAYWKMERLLSALRSVEEMENNLMALKRATLIMRSSIKKKIEMIADIQSSLRDTGKKIDGKLDELKKLEARTIYILDRYDITGVKLSVNEKKVFEKILLMNKKLEEIDVLDATISSLIKRVRESPILEKISPGEKVVQKKAEKRFLLLKDRIEGLKTKGGLIDALFTSILKEPVVKRAVGDLVRIDRSSKRLKGHGNRQKDEVIRMDLLKKHVQSKLERTDNLILEANGALYGARRLKKKTLSALNHSVEDMKHRAMEAINRREALLRYVNGRSILILAGKGKEYNKDLDFDPYRSALGEFKSALALGLPERVLPECFYVLSEIIMTLEEDKFARKMDSIMGEKDSSEDYPEPVMSYSQSLPYLEKVVREYPESHYYEKALYRLAFLQYEMGKREKAIRAYEMLIKKFPSTPYSDEINMRIAEYYFNRDDYSKAETYYRNVKGEKSPEIYITSRFKLAWSLYNLERYVDAASQFLIPIVSSIRSKELKYASLFNESLQMMAKSFIESGNTLGIIGMLEKAQIPEISSRAILTQEKILFDSARFEKVIELADLIRGRYKYSREIIESENLAAQAMIRLLREKSGYDRLYKTLILFGPDSAWFRYNGKNKELVNRALDQIEKNLRLAGYYYFKSGKKEKAKGKFKQSIIIFRDYLKNFPLASYSADVRFDLANSLFEIGSYRTASKVFLKIALQGALKKLSEPSLYMAIQCYKAEYSEDHTELADGIIKLSSKYLEMFPQSEKKDELLVDLASSLFNIKRYGKAVSVAIRLAQESEDAGKRAFANRLVAESYFNSEKFVLAEAAFRKVLKSLPKEKKKERGKINKFIGFSIFKHANVIYKENPLEGANEYLRLYREFPELPFSPIAALESGKAFHTAGNDPRALSIFRNVVKSHPDTPYGREATRQIALISEAHGNLAEAAEHYSLIGSKLSGEVEGALYTRKAATLYYDMGLYPEAASSYSRLLNSPGLSEKLKVKTSYFAGMSYLNAGKVKKGISYFNKAVSLNAKAGKNSKNLLYASLSLFRLASINFDRYRTLRIREPFEKTVAMKKNALKKLIKQYLSIARFAVPETLSASLYQVGRCYEEFKSAILSAPMPKGLSNMEQEEYIFLLEEKAAPYEVEAVKAHRNNLTKAAKFGYFNEWVRKSWQNLVDLRPAVYGRKPLFPDFTSPIHSIPSEKTILGVAYE